MPRRPRSAGSTAAAPIHERVDGARRGSLIVVGTGLMLARHATLETVEAISCAGHVFHLVSNSATEAWIRRLNPNATSLGDCLAEGKPRTRSYSEIAGRIVEAVRGGVRVCAAFYGHPGVLVTSGRAAIARARAEGFDAHMLPGISAEDCLIADLAVPAPLLCWQSYEATDFLLYRRRIDPTVALILWQAGMLGEPSVRRDMRARPERLRVLTRVLLRHYSPRHPVVLYEAAQLPTSSPIVERVTLASLPRQSIYPKTTLYVAPRPATRSDAAVARWLMQA
ncbi:MAG TPA: SAM-dependent methyltransferase [Vicinamibacterales bacterium]|jgi:precorrin-3B methylase|nr:SAM-dependent methyltransferase [Vicinamibacterales bacterium]